MIIQRLISCIDTTGKQKRVADDEQGGKHAEPAMQCSVLVALGNVACRVLRKGITLFFGFLIINQLL